MTISTNTKKALLYGVPVLIGAYLIYRQITKVMKPPVISTIKSPSTPNIPTKPSGNDALPLKIGSRDAGSPANPSGRVVDMQRLINYIGYVPEGQNNYVKLVEDGVFGKKTEAALNFWIQQKTIDTQADYNYLYNMIHPTVPTVDTSSDTLNSYQNNNVINF
jgi:hypothetical protein